MRDSDSNDLPLILIVVFLVVGVGLTGFFWYRTTVARQRAFLQEALAAEQAAVARTEAQALYPVPKKGRNDSAQSQAPELRCVSWNVESDGNDPAVIAEQLVELGDYDIIALQEVHSRNVARYGGAVRNAHGNFRYFATDTGRSDRLMIIYNEDKLELQSFEELFAFGGLKLNDWRHRSPLVAHFRDVETGTEFLFLTVHLARGNSKLRQEQARGLREWAKAQMLPVVALRDFNMDYDFPTQKGNKAFDEFMAGDVWKWVKPAELVDTNWSDPENDGVDNYPDSCLDFAFVAGTAKDWKAQSRVIVRDGDFPDDERTADHRPVELTIRP